MIYLFIILLGIVQGATEFLPVSSSGHLVLLYNIFGITDDTVLLSIFLHVATLLAVIVVYRKQIWTLIKNPFCNTNKKLLLSTVITGILAILLKKFITGAFGGSSLVYCFLVTAIILVIADITSKKYTKHDPASGMLSSDITNLNINYTQALVVGFMQGLACFPGISRSGSTIASAMVCGVDKRDAADYSFLLSIPIILASLLMELVDLNGNVISFPIPAILLGCLLSFVVGLICIKFLLVIVKKQKLVYFSIYLVLLSLFLILNQYVFHLF